MLFRLSNELYEPLRERFLFFTNLHESLIKGRILVVEHDELFGLMHVYLKLTAFISE